MIGLSTEEFWTLSLRELWNEFIAFRIRSERDRQADLTMAWMTAALSRTKELPPLAQLLGGSRRRQTLREQRIALTMIFGSRGRPRLRPS